MLEWMGEANAAALIGLIGGLVLGVAARVGRFCTLGAIEDYLYGNDDRRLRMWGIAIGVAVISVHIAMANGIMEAAATAYLDRVWNPIATIVGGLMFGYGMALSGNCGYGALARLGGGDLRSFVILIIMGLSAYFVMSGPLAQYTRLALLGRNRGDKPARLHAVACGPRRVRAHHWFGGRRVHLGLSPLATRYATDPELCHMGNGGGPCYRVRLGRHILDRGPRFRFGTHRDT